MQMEISMKACGVTIWPMDMAHSKINQEDSIRENGKVTNNKAMDMNITLMAHSMKDSTSMDSNMAMVDLSSIMEVNIREDSIKTKQKGRANMSGKINRRSMMGSGKKI